MLDIYDETRVPQALQVMRKVHFTGEWLRAWQHGSLTTPTDVDYGLRLKELGTPTLILHGEKDMRLPVSVAKRLATEVSQAQLEVIARVGHLAHIESTQTWNRILVKFVTGNSMSESP